ncbi:MAG: alpha/beta hydrolase [Pseudomonadota bacterium]|nr:alpha/beta hydrolase [Pseudomonadota bacterium]
MSELDDLMAFLRKQPPAHTVSLAERRALYDRAEKAFRLPDGVVTEAWQHGALSGDLLRVAGADPKRLIVYLHGGGYGIGSPRSHRHLAAAIGVAAKSDVLVPDYRLAPEHAYPAARLDALAACDWAAKNRPGLRLAVIGDSAGGGLVVSTLTGLRDSGAPQAAAGVCISPWVDLDCSPGTDVANAAADDPMVDAADIAEYATAYLGGTPATDPGASPIHADLAGLPPLLIQASNAEALRFDSLRLDRAARAAGVDVTLQMEDGVPHVWQWFWPRLEIARKSIADIAAWLEPRWAA